jgi:hypothetical protein
LALLLFRKTQEIASQKKIKKIIFKPKNLIHMKKFTILASLLFATTLVYMIGCTKDTTSTATTVDCTSVSAKFTADILPIMKSATCAGSSCHPKYGTLDSYADVKGHVDAGHFNSKVIERNGSPMPPVGSTQLTADELKKIKCWKQNGYLNN